MAAPAAPVHLRVNQVGYLPGEGKIAVAFASTEIAGSFSVIREDSGEPAFTGKITKSSAPGWDGGFAHHYLLDFSRFDAPGRYRVRFDGSGEVSRPFTIGATAYGDAVEELLRFMRQQRCGHNPVLDAKCHQKDGRTAYGPLPAGTAIVDRSAATTQCENFVQPSRIGLELNVR